MKKAEQTPELITRMYDLTTKYTRAVQPIVYKQYRGDVDDLASEIFMKFMSPRGLHDKETLLDKYDASLRPKSMTPEAFFDSLVKTCVRRALIDYSKMDQPGRIKSLDDLQSRCGDSITNAFDLAMQDDDSVDSLDLNEMKGTIAKRYVSMSDNQRTALRAYYKKVKPALNEQFKSVFGEVFKIK